MQLSGPQPSEPRTIEPNLGSMPPEVLFNIVKYLDVGEVVPLVGTNRHLRYHLLSSNAFWRSRLPSIVKTHFTKAMLDNPWETVKLYLYSRRCCDCFQMEHTTPPWISQFFRKTICHECRRNEQYEMISASRAKRFYFLSFHDLATLRAESTRNPARRRSHYQRLFSLADVRRRSTEKLLQFGMTREERLLKQRRLSKTRKEAWARRVAHRRDSVRRRLRDYGISLPATLHCRELDTFIRGGWRNYKSRTRWSLDEVVDIIIEDFVML